MNGRYGPGDIVLGNWTLVRLIGEGSYGKVYEAQREDFGVTYKAAVKIITIPQSESEIKSARSEGMDDASVTAYFRSFVEEIVQEFVLMSKLKGNSNVVSYEDHMVVPHGSGVGWDIIIRMELLAPLVDYVQTHSLSQEEVIKLGVDLCKALELCQKFNIVHRDIKPENIFISSTGDYKLGDFGIARTVEKTTGGLSKKGTYTYMAPEVYKEESYGPSVDMYSLGIVMYRLLNENRAPFLPPYPAPITHSDRENAMAKRMTGASFPRPRNADERLTETVLKACAYKPSDRYAAPTEMRQALEAILNGREEPTAPKEAFAEGTVRGFDATEAFPTGGEETVGSWSDFRRNAPQNEESLWTNLVLTFEEAALGCTKEINLERSETWDEHMGSGVAPRKQRISVTIPAGIENGQAISIRNLDGVGNLMIRIQIKPHPQFRRDGTTVLYEQYVSSHQAAKGAELEIPTIDGNVKFSLPAGTQTDTTFRLKGKGIPELRSGQRGDQYVTVKVQEAFQSGFAAKAKGPRTEAPQAEAEQEERQKKKTGIPMWLIIALALLGFRLLLWLIRLFAGAGTAY